MSVPFHRELLDAAADERSVMLEHPFLADTAQNRVDRQAFRRWLAQDFLYARELLRVMGLLLVRSPFDLSAIVLDGLIAMRSELQLFEREAARHGVELTAEMDPACLDYVSFLQATAQRGDLVESWAAFYGQEQAYLDSWRQVKSLQTTVSPYQSFIDNWTSDAFTAYVDGLAAALDGLALGIPDRTRAKVELTFRRVIQYEIRFWDMALGGG